MQGPGEDVKETSRPQLPLPDLDGSAGEDRPPTPRENPAIASPEALQRNDESIYRTVTVDDPDKRHRRTVEFQKLKFGMWLIAGCLVVVIILHLLDYYFPKQGSSFASLNDLLKLVATTVLGYVFGLSIGTDKEEN